VTDAVDPRISQFARAIALLDQGKSYTAVARELGIDRRTLYDWRHDPAFQVLQQDLADGILHATRQELRALMRYAVGVLRKGLLGQATAAQVQAALAVLDRSGLNAGAAPEHAWTDEELDELAGKVGWQRKEGAH
jgi:transposase-like protein